MSQKFFLYARKSTDVEDKQVLSIDAQITELRAFAKNEKLEIVEEFVEKRTAKIPGRPIFGEMMRRIEKGEVSGIISWHPDRLARNSVDGGQIVYFLDIGNLASLKFPSHWFENTPQGKFSLSMAFVQSKYYVDSLSENTKRGLRQKVRMGIFPSQAPVGYLNDSRTKTIVVEKKKSRIVRLAFERYTKKRISKTRVSFILSNPFYVGLFNYAKELHEGKHEPIISKKLFDEAQEMLRKRGQPERKPQNEPQPFCGLISCASCGMMITGEHKFKRQKNGNVHEYTYYRCTKKSKTIKCSESAVREKELDRQLSSLIQKVSLPKDWAEELLKMAENEHGESAQSLTSCVKEKEEKISSLSKKLERLLAGYLDQDIEKEVYRVEKGKLILQKKSLEEEITNLSHKQNDWLEPMKECPNSFGKMGGNQWDALRASHLLASKKPFSSFVVPRTGVEPASLSALPPQGSACTNFATWATQPLYQKAETE
ncbi:MAG: Recombinase [Parcubacteria group bacterium GW2011_GWA1_47_10]|nr:MAG: Recombinase [Parcubacteria group bacterium GW2011_GWA1_47_10]